MLDTLSPLVVHNKSDQTITIGWNNAFTTIPPGETRTAQFDAVVNFFGDPRSIDNMHSNTSEQGIVSWIPDRPAEMRRLQCKWGNTFADDEGTIRAPEVEVTTLSGERVWTVLEDPKGEHVNPHLIQAGHQVDLENQITTMQAQMDTLLRMKENGEEMPTEVTPEEIPADDNASPRRGGRIHAKNAQDDN